MSAHARPKLTHMPHLLDQRGQVIAAKVRQAQAVRRREQLCKVCGKDTPFGFNDFRHAPELAVFACREHREEVAKALE